MQPSPRHIVRPHFQHSSLFAKNLPEGIGDDEIRFIFSRFRVLRIHFISGEEDGADSWRRRLWGEMKGARVAQVEFSSIAIAEKAFALTNPYTIPGSYPSITLTLTPSREQSPFTSLFSGYPRLVKPLPSHFTDMHLYDLIRRFGALASARVDGTLGGVVQFWNENDARAAETSVGLAFARTSKITLQAYDPRTIVCFNLPPNVDELGLKALFEQFGFTASIRVIYNDEDNIYGLVSFFSPNEASNAIHSLHGSRLESKELVLRYHEPGTSLESAVQSIGNGRATQPTSTPTKQQGSSSPTIALNPSSEEATKTKKAVELLESERKKNELREQENQKKLEEQTRKEQEEAKRKEREQAVQKAREATERKAREENERKEREKAQQKEREIEQKKREDAKKELENAKQKEHEEGERKKHEEAEQKKREEAEQKALKEAKQRADEIIKKKEREEAERKRRVDAEQQERESNVLKTREEAEQREREAKLKGYQEDKQEELKVAERRAHEEAERKERGGIERKREEDKREGRGDAERQAREKFEKEKREEAERKEREEAERKREEARQNEREEAVRKAQEEAKQKEAQQKEETRLKKWAEATKAKQERCRARDDGAWGLIPWADKHAFRRTVQTGSEFLKLKFSEEQPLVFECIPWPVLRNPTTLSLGDITPDNVKAFFASLEASGNTLKYNTLLDIITKLFRPDKWRTRKALETVMDPDLRQSLEKAGNMVSLVATSLKQGAKDEGSVSVKP